METSKQESVSVEAIVRAPVRRTSSQRPGVDDKSRSIMQDVRVIHSPARAHSPYRCSVTMPWLECWADALWVGPPLGVQPGRGRAQAEGQCSRPWGGAQW